MEVKAEVRYRYVRVLVGVFNKVKDAFNGLKRDWLDPKKRPR